MDSVRKLTASERATLNKAWRIIEECTAPGSSWSIGAGCYNKTSFSYDVCYFDSNEPPSRGQHMWVKGQSFADKIQTVLEIEAKASTQAEHNRILRIERIRKELADLTGEPA